MTRWICAGLAASLALVAGCAAVEPYSDAPGTVAADCARWFPRLDEAVDRAGAPDAGAHRIPGFPYLRADRFSASFRYQAENDPAAFAEWVDRLRALDAAARRDELRNLPALSIGSPAVIDWKATAARSDSCAAELRPVDLASPAQRKALVERAAVPDDYIDLNRVVGLYPLVAMPLSIGINRWQEDTVAGFRRTASGEADPGPIVRYEPVGQPAGAPEVAKILARAPTGRLGVPQLSHDDRETLLRTFAPIYEIATSGDYDRFGRLAWGAGAAPEVDVRHPAVYRRLALTRYRDRVLVQLVYTIWFPERPRSASLDLLAGKLDGLVFRATLDTRGRPLVYDTIHPCGCYHMLFPTPRAQPRPAPQPGIEWAFVPATLPPIDPARRLVLRISSGSHYLAGLSFARGGSGRAYSFAEEDDLRALPTAGGTTRSAFGPDGIVPGTERGERLLFWPTGVDSTGAMRQWGRQATAFLGRRHFDDPDLIERRFSITEP